MAARKGCYVYRIFDRHETVYVGKGSGRRIDNQKRKFGFDAEVIEYCKNDDHAFQRERHWIAELYPTVNKSAGGNGGRVRAKLAPKLPKWLRDFYKELNEAGSRRYTARFLCRKLNETNCERFGVSKVDLFRLREVANGPWC